MTRISETLRFLEAVTIAMTVFGDDFDTINVVEGILDRTTRYIRLADLTNEDRIRFLKEATEEVARLNDGDMELLDEQLDRIRERSARIAAMTAQLEEELHN